VECASDDPPPSFAGRRQPGDTTLCSQGGPESKSQGMLGSSHDASQRMYGR